MSVQNLFPVLIMMAACVSAGHAAEEARPRVMHAEMVTLGDSRPAHSLKVADAHAPAAEAPAPRPRMFEMPLIDKSQAEDPFKNAPSPAAPPPRCAGARCQGSAAAWFGPETRAGDCGPPSAQTAGAVGGAGIDPPAARNDAGNLRSPQGGSSAANSRRTDRTVGTDHA